MKTDATLPKKLPDDFDNPLTRISKALDVLESYREFALDIGNVVDATARMDALSKRLDKLAKANKDYLWNKVLKQGMSRYEIHGRGFVANLVVVESHAFNIKRFAVERPKLYEAYLEPRESCRTTFKAKG